MTTGVVGTVAGVAAVGHTERRVGQFLFWLRYLVGQPPLLLMQDLLIIRNYNKYILYYKRMTS